MNNQYNHEGAGTPTSHCRHLQTYWYHCSHQYRISESSLELALLNDHG